MANSNTALNNNEQTTLHELEKLSSAIQALPEQYREGLVSILNRVVASGARQHRVLGLAKEALSQLRLDTKYLVFDLEATRRERDLYREQLEK